jgi:hypothetical protein
VLPVLVREGREFAIDGTVRRARIDAFLLVSLHHEAGDRVEPHGAEERLQVHAQPPALDRDVFA